MKSISLNRVLPSHRTLDILKIGVGTHNWMYVTKKNFQVFYTWYKSFLKGFFKCRKNLRSVCSEFEGNNRRPVPIPKRRFEGNCPILGQTIPKVDLATISLPDCPCVDGNSVRFLYFLNSYGGPLRKIWNKITNNLFFF